MGRRYISEEIPDQVQYRAAPQLAEQYKEFGSEEFERGERVRQAHEAAQAQDRQMDLNSSDKINSGVTQGINSGLEAYDKAQQRQRQDREEQRQNKVSEEQIAGSKQTREQSAALHPGAVKAQEAAISGQEAQNKVVAVQADEAEKGAAQRNAKAQKIASLPDNDPMQPRSGETVREHLARMDIEKNTFDMQTTRQGLENAKADLDIRKQQLAAAKDMAPLQKKALQSQINAQSQQIKVAQMDYDDRVLAKSVKGAKNEILAALNNNKDVAAQGAALKAIEAKYNDPKVFTEGLAEARTAGLNSQILINALNAANPDFARAQQKRYSVEDKASEYKKSVANLYFNANKYKNSNGFLSDATGDTALKDFQDTLRSFKNPAFDAYAARLDAKVDINEGWSGLGREDRMLKTADDVKKLLSNEIKVGGDHPKSREFADELSQVNYEPAKKGKDFNFITGQGGDPSQFSVNNIPGAGGLTKLPAKKVTNNVP